MGNKNPAMERILEIGKRRLREYKDSPQKRIGKLISDGTIEKDLKLGDIICCKLTEITEKSTIGTVSAHSAGLSTHYAIYAGKQPGNKHLIIEKVANKGTENPIKQVTIEDSELMEWLLVVDCRYSDTYDMAKKTMDNHEDGGYSFTHANCEHFVTYCLCRHTDFSISRDALVDRIARKTVGAITSAASELFKIVSHPLYMLGGDATLDQRLTKANLPFGQGIDEDGIASGRKWFFGDTFGIGCWNEFPADSK